MSDAVARSLEYYSTPGPMTDPRALAHLFDDLPREVGSLCRVIQGLMLHIFWAERYGARLSVKRQGEVNLRAVDRKLARILDLDPRPLLEQRPLDQRLVGNCRDFTLMLTAMLRRQGTPARARCGFGRYFNAGTYEDHWVCEYWNAQQQRWVLVDAQLDEFQRQALQLSFDPLDVPRSMFITGGKAWKMCRLGQADPEKFGIFKMRGLWFICGDFIRDVAALNKMELLPWDGWGLIEKDFKTLAAGDLAFLDELAALTAEEVPDFDAVRELYESDERLRVGPVITTYLDSGPRKITLAEEVAS